MTTAVPPVRVEYLGFTNVGEHREFRLRVRGPEGPAEFRIRIALAAFGDGRVSIQDGPDVSYQRLGRAVAAGETANPGVITIDDRDLASYREAKVPPPKRPSWTLAPRPDPPAVPLATTTLNLDALSLPHA